MILIHIILIKRVHEWECSSRRGCAIAVWKYPKNVKYQSLSSVQPLAASSAFLSRKRPVPGTCFGTCGRDISPSAPKPCVGGIILQWPFHLWPPMGSSSWLGQTGGSEGRQTLSPFPTICPVVDCLPLDRFLSGVVTLQHAHGADCNPFLRADCVI